MKQAQGFSLIELLVVVTVISVIAAITVPSLLRARMNGNEASAIAALKAVTQAEVAYASACGQNAYAVSFAVLGTPAPNTTGGFISADLGLAAMPQQSGYAFALGPGLGAAPGPSDCNGTPTRTAYYATAVPQTFGSTGTRAFATNQSNLLWERAAGGAPSEPFGPPAARVQ